jgi:hypothetical protein
MSIARSTALAEKGTSKYLLRGRIIIEKEDG